MTGTEVSRRARGSDAWRRELEEAAARWLECHAGGRDTAAAAARLEAVQAALRRLERRRAER